MTPTWGQYCLQIVVNNHSSSRTKLGPRATMYLGFSDPANTGFENQLPANVGF